MSLRRVRLGMLTPSSNTVLEPATARMVATMEGVSAHFSRFGVTQISLDEAGLAQFDMEPMLGAARLLADAKVDVITWNGTSASWLGLDADRRLVDAIQAETGITASTCILSLVESFRLAGVRSYGLVTPYTRDVQARIVDNFSAEGFSCAAERHFGLRNNFSFATVDETRIAGSIRSVAACAADAIVILCTNLAGAGLVAELEDETNIPIVDSVCVTVWGALRAAGARADDFSRWGRLLAA